MYQALPLEYYISLQHSKSCRFLGFSVFINLLFHASDGVQTMILLSQTSIIVIHCSDASNNKTEDIS